MPRDYRIRVGRRGRALTRAVLDAVGALDSRSAVLTPAGGITWPTSSNTGYRTSLTTETATTLAPGSTVTDKHFVNGLNLDGVSNISLTDCKITGQLVLGYAAATNRNFSYCEIDGNSTGGGSAVGGRNFNMDHCKIHNAAQGIFGGTGLYEYNWISDMYISGETHGECVLVYGDNSEFRYNTLIAQYRSGGNQTTPGGGFSACLVLYNHGDTWDGRTNCWVHHNRLSIPAPGSYTTYWGTPPDATVRNPMTNCDLTDNTYVKVPGSTTSATSNAADIVRDPAFGGGSGCSITNNRYEDDGLLVQGTDA